MYTRSRTRPRLHTEADPHVLEELRRAKDISMACLTKKQRNAKFRRFANCEELDRFLLAAGAYFDALFRSLQDTPQPGSPAEEGGSPAPAALGGIPDRAFLERTTVDNDHIDVQVKGKQMAMAYATILLKEGSNYNQLHNEEIFFEALYEFTARVTNTKFDRKYWSIVESELGRLFRSPVRPRASSRPLAPRARGLTAAVCAARRATTRPSASASSPRRCCRRASSGYSGSGSARTPTSSRPPRPAGSARGPATARDARTAGYRSTGWWRRPGSRR